MTRPSHLPSWPIGSCRIAVLHRFDKEEKGEGVNYIELRVAEEYGSSDRGKSGEGR